MLFPTDSCSSGDLGCSHPQAEALRLPGCERLYAPNKLGPLTSRVSSQSTPIYFGADMNLGLKF